MKKLLFISTALVAFGAGPAHADPVSIGAWISATFAVGATAGVALAHLAIGIGTAIVSTALRKVFLKAPSFEQSYDVNFDAELGDDTELKFCVGNFATAGKRKYMREWGKNTRFVTEVIEYSCLPQDLSDLWVDDVRADWMHGKVGAVVGVYEADDIYTLTAYDVGDPDLADAVIVGTPVMTYSDDDDNGDLGARIWVKRYDGTQTEADPFLVWAFGTGDYPWTADHVGSGKSYLIITTRFDDNTLSSYPSYLIEPSPLPMYDPRLDSTAGGMGAHRWGDRSTYTPSSNNAVICYNIARGIYLGSEWVYGGKNMAAWRLPFAEWIAAMNACEEEIDLDGGGAEPAYRCGAEIAVSTEPLSVMEELGKGANMRFAEVGGMLKPLVGLPGASVVSITDGDIVITAGQSLTPFSPASATYNALSATYTEPDEKWGTKDSPEYVSMAWTAADGGRYLPTSLSYPAVPHAAQVQRLMRSQLEDYRRMRQHAVHLPPDAYGLEPLDMITWSSDRNGYVSKAFLVEQIQKLPGMCVAVTLRECDPGDYDWSTEFELPYSIIAPVNPVPVAQGISGFTALATSILDGDDTARSPAILVGCDGDESGVYEVRIQVRRSGDADPLLDVTRPYADPHQWTITGVLPATTYQVRGQLLSDRFAQSIWSGWITVTTGAFLIDGDQVAEGAISAQEHGFTTPYADTSDANFIVVNGTADTDVIVLDSLLCDDSHDVMISVSCNLDAPDGEVWGLWKFWRQVGSGAWEMLRTSDTGRLDSTVGAGGMAPFSHVTFDTFPAGAGVTSRIYKATLARSPAAAARKIRACRIAMSAWQLKR